ncbi:hypothetical protein E1263_35160 [Kribbella antibiotica]|uniref:Uncharacterized protein n=1 Tax=Kribbella antibiotica TaxID=190195 RepID=A0A4R4YU14_9ACTN|nr:hypothetical protein [Kribbella antibiotica]TDD47112.1 hypothetical protein E1263_35160 [Kribbella antibiotica]
MDERWAQLFHQGTVSAASYAALPELARMSALGVPGALHLAAAIVGAEDGPEDRAAVRERYAAEIAVMSSISRQGLPSAGDDTDFLFGLQALAWLEDWGLPGFEGLANGELSLACPACGDDLLLDVDAAEPRARACGGEWADRCVVDKLRYLLGTAVCPECGTALPWRRAWREGWGVALSASAGRVMQAARG